MTSYQVRTSDNAVSFQQTNDDHSLLQAALRGGIAFPYECSSGGCGSCRYTPVAGDFEQLWEDAPGLSKRARRKGLQLACQTRARSELEIDFRTDEPCRPVIAPSRCTVRLEARQDLTRDITDFRLRAPSEAQFLPGQYAILENLAGVRRCYSMSNTANEDGVWDFQIKRVPGGTFTETMFDALPGEEFVLDGPYGMAYLRTESPRDVLCIAGGSGLSPMISIARGIAEDDNTPSRQVHFFYGGRTAADICGYNELTKTGLDDQLNFTPVVSEPDDPLSLGWDGYTGFVHEAVVESLGGSVSDMEIYFAGPPPMAEATQRALMIDLQVPFDQIHFDRFF